MASDDRKKYVLSNVEKFAKKNSFNDTFKIAKTWEEIGFHVSALSYNGFRVITLSRWGSGVFQLFFIGDTFLKTRYSLGTIHDVGITQWTKDYIDNPYGIQRIWFNIKNGYQEGDKCHYKEFLKNKSRAYIDENMKKQTIKLNESQLRKMIKESIKNVLNENERDVDDDTYFGGGLPDSYYQDHAHERPNEYDNGEPSIPEDIRYFFYARLKNQPYKVDRFDAKNLNALNIRLGNTHRELRNHIGEENSIKYIREYVKYYLPDYKTVYNKLCHMVEEAKWLFNENI